MSALHARPALRLTLGRTATAASLACALVAAAPAVLAQAAAAGTAKPRIEKAADLPRFSYPVQGQLEDIVRSAERFAPLAGALRRDTESVLAGYDIPDRATQRELLGRLATLDYLDGRYDAALARIEQLRALQDKPADKLCQACVCAPWPRRPRPRRAAARPGARRWWRRWHASWRPCPMPWSRTTSRAPRPVPS